MLRSIHSEVTHPGASQLIVAGGQVASSLFNDTGREEDRYVTKSIFPSDASQVENHFVDLANPSSSSSILQESAQNISNAIQEVFSEPAQIVESASLTAAGEGFLPSTDPTFSGLAQNTTAIIEDSLQASTVFCGYPGGEPPGDPMGELTINASLKGSASSRPLSLSLDGFIPKEPGSNSLFNRILLGVAAAVSVFFLGRSAFRAYQRHRELAELEATEKKTVQPPRVHQVKKKKKAPKQQDLNFQSATFQSRPLNAYKNLAKPSLFYGNSTSF